MPREASRDIVRGLNALEMIVVNISAVSWLQHSAFIGLPTYADTIFPTFAMLAGMSRITPRRSVAMVGLGLSLNVVQGFVKQIPTRLPGVLQRLALSGLLLEAPMIRQLADSRPMLLAAALSAIWYIVSIALADDSSNPLANPKCGYARIEGTAASKLDRMLFSERIYTQSYDPEGLLGCLTTAATMLAGRYLVTLSGPAIYSMQTIAAAVGALSAGLVLHHSSPAYGVISKALWTPAFVLATTGWATIKYASLSWLINATELVPGRLQSVFRAAGQRSLELYMISSLASLALQYDRTQQAVPGKRRYSTHFARDDSIWARSLTYLTEVIMRVGDALGTSSAQLHARSLADLALSVSLAGSMAFIAVWLVRTNRRLSL
ncbi:hypothetical protein PYCC9005_000033 [Savitreella phatthalungensis]